MFRWLIDHILGIPFRLKVGFWKCDLRRLYIKLVERDDGIKDGELGIAGEVTEKVGLNRVTFCNNVFRIGKFKLSVGGDYEDGKNLNVTVIRSPFNPKRNRIVLRADYYKKCFEPGVWQNIIKLMIREYL